MVVILLHTPSYQRPSKHSFIKPKVLGDHFCRTVTLGTFIHNSFNDLTFEIIWLFKEFHGFGNGPQKACGIADLKKKPVARISLDLKGLDRIVNSTRVMYNRQAAADGADHLRKAARLKGRRHEYKIRGSVCQMRELFVVISDYHAPMQVVRANKVQKKFLKFSS